MNIRGEQIKNLVTKFYYQNNHLCFQIFLLFDQDRSLIYSEHTDYAEYKKTYGDLLNAKTNNLSLELPKNNLETSSLILA